jgi:hypothetical protein
VETPNGMIGKKAHTCHLHLPNALYCELVCDLDAHFVRKDSTSAAQREWFFYATLSAQADADSNQQTASPKVRHATHSATRFGIAWWLIKCRNRRTYYLLTIDSLFRSEV